MQLKISIRINKCFKVAGYTCRWHKTPLKMKKLILFTLLYVSVILLLFSCDDSNSDVVPGGAGLGGSMARFTVAGDFLYIVDTRKLHVYDLNNPADPVKIKDVHLGVNIETIFPYQGKLFVGSQDGMHIYDIQNPMDPVFLSTYRHITSCDPVVVQDTLAYVTLRTDNSCQRGWNQLDIINIKDPENPQLITSYQMKSPFGLGIDGSVLFVGEGENGLTVLNVEDPYNIRELGRNPEVHAYDVILRNKNLILTGNDGVFQYDYSGGEDLELLSSLTVADCR